MHSPPLYLPSFLLPLIISLLFIPVTSSPLLLSFVGILEVEAIISVEVVVRVHPGVEALGPPVSEIVLSTIVVAVEGVEAPPGGGVVPRAEPEVPSVEARWEKCLGVPPARGITVKLFVFWCPDVCWCLTDIRIKLL